MNFVEFEDYIRNYINIDNLEWITIFEKNIDANSNFKNDVYTFSVLVENKDDLIKKCYKDFSWGFSVDYFGKSYFGKRYFNGIDEVFFESGELYEIYEYLIAVRTFSGKYDSIVEINPKLIWYNNLVAVEGGYVSPETDELLIKVTKDNIKVKSRYLKDFLSAYNKCCIINFDHRRFFKFDSELKYKSRIVDMGGVKANIVQNTYKYDEYNAMSSVLGKVIVKPFKKPIHDDYVEYTEEKEYEKFIIGEEIDTGKSIEFTCDENKLSNFFGANPDAPHFLTPVFFDKKILNHYTQDTSNYTVKDSLIIHLDKWSLPFTVNNDNKVVVWLGDLGRIPYKEQKVWKAYNTNPNGEIEENFFRRQLMCEWTDASLGEKGILNKIDNINKIFIEKYGDVLFNELSVADKELESALLIPATNSVPVYQNFLMQLCKVTVERINTKLIAANVSKELLEDERAQKYGSRMQLNVFLKQIKLKNADRLDNVLKIIYNSRNKLSGHAGSFGEYNKVWGREKNYKINFIYDAKNITSTLNNVLNDIIEELNNEEI